MREAQVTGSACTDQVVTKTACERLERERDRVCRAVYRGPLGQCSAADKTDIHFRSRIFSILQAVKQYGTKLYNIIQNNQMVYL